MANGYKMMKKEGYWCHDSYWVGEYRYCLYEVSVMYRVSEMGAECAEHPGQ